MKLIGIGGCGVNIVSKMIEREVLHKQFRYAIIDLDPSYANRFHMKGADTECVCLFPTAEFINDIPASERKFKTTTNFVRLNRTCIFVS